MRIYAECFGKIGFGFSFKQDILEALVEDSPDWDVNRFCNPKRKRKSQNKHRDPKEKDPSLPEPVRKHFNTAWKICKAVGCKQGKPGPQLALSEEWNEIND